MCSGQVCAYVDVKKGVCEINKQETSDECEQLRNSYIFGVLF